MARATCIAGVSAAAVAVAHEVIEAQMPLASCSHGTRSVSRGQESHSFMPAVCATSPSGAGIGIEPCATVASTISARDAQCGAEAPSGSSPKATARSMTVNPRSVNTNGKVSVAICLRGRGTISFRVRETLILRVPRGAHPLHGETRAADREATSSDWSRSAEHPVVRGRPGLRTPSADTADEMPPESRRTRPLHEKATASSSIASHEHPHGCDILQRWPHAGTHHQQQSAESDVLH